MLDLVCLKIGNLRIQLCYNQSKIIVLHLSTKVLNSSKIVSISTFLCGFEMFFSFEFLSSPRASKSLDLSQFLGKT